MRAATYTREQALKRIRRFLATQRRGDETTCQTAARLGIFCRGYDRWSTDQLRRLYPTIAQQLPPDASRDELLELIQVWDKARLILTRAPTTCDAKALDNEGCLGFDRFSNEQLKRLFPRLFRKSDRIISA